MRLVTLTTSIRLFFLSVYLLPVQTISAQSVREYLRGVLTACYRQNIIR